MRTRTRCPLATSVTRAYLATPHDPVQALREYRERTGIAARLVVVGMVANAFTIADPEDPGMLDIVGFDSATPEVVSGFARGVV